MSKYDEYESMELKDIISTVNRLMDEFKMEQKRWSVSGFRRMRGITLRLEKLMKVFRKKSPKSTEELKSFKGE